MVEFREIAIVHDLDMGEISRELSRLIDSGHNRIAPNFGTVQHMSSQLLGIVLQCSSGAGPAEAC